MIKARMVRSRTNSAWSSGFFMLQHSVGDSSEQSEQISAEQSQNRLRTFSKQTAGHASLPPELPSSSHKRREFALLQAIALHKFGRMSSWDFHAANFPGIPLPFPTVSSVEDSGQVVRGGLYGSRCGEFRKSKSTNIRTFSHSPQPRYISRNGALWWVQISASQVQTEQHNSSCCRGRLSRQEGTSNWHPAHCVPLTASTPVFIAWN